MLLVALIGTANSTSAQCERRVWDRTLPPPQVQDGWFYDSAVWDDGSGPTLYGVGFIAVQEQNGNWVDGVARWNGVNWEPVGGGVGYTNHVGYPEVHEVTVFDNDLIIGGDFTRVGNVGVGNIARWDGTNWFPLGAGFHNIVYSLGTFNDQLVAGYDGGVAIWNGTSWTTLGVTGLGTVQAIAEYNGNLYVGGDFTSINGVVATGLARWNGTNWSSMGLNGYVWALTGYNSELIAGGSFGNAGGVTAGAVARWNGTTWAPLGNPSAVHGEVYSLAEFEGALVVGGTFGWIDNFPAGLVAQWNKGGSGAWSSMGGGQMRMQIDDFIGSFNVLNGDLIATGRFYAQTAEPGGWTRLNWSRWECTSVPNQPPTADVGGPYSASRFQHLIIGGPGSGNPDGGLLYYLWNFGDGTSAVTGNKTISHNYTSVGTFNVTLTTYDGEAWSSPSTTTATITAPNAPPNVSLTSPAHNATFTAPANMTLTASASDSDGTVVEVEFFNGATSLGVDTTAPYSLAWNNVPTGSYTLTARARDNQNATTTSSPVIVKVEVALSPSADASVRDGSSANSNFGGATSLEVRNSTSGNNRWTYLKFDTSAMTTVSGAKLRLFGALSGTTSATVRTAAYGASNVMWGENTLTWNNKPASGSTALATVTMANSTVARWYEWNLTSYIQQEKAAGRHVVTVVLKNTTTSTVNDAFNSKEASTNKPVLAVTP